MRRFARRPFTLCPAASLLVCVAAGGLTGCMPLKQESVTGGRRYDHFTYRGRYGLLTIGSSTAPKRVTVVDTESYAVGPDGRRYGIETEPERRGRGRDGPPNAGDRVYLLDAKGRRGNVFVDRGRWEFLFALDTPEGRDARQFTVDVSTFNYVPLVHGPPN